MAAIVPDLQTAFGIAGATAGTLVVYTFPAFMYLMVTESILQKVIAVLVMICSIVMGCASTVVLIIDAVRDHIPITSL
ncbi:Transmembrane amino acid transporter protein [compost metagenome]